jgi:type I restriction enzyme, S subunit
LSSGSTPTSRNRLKEAQLLAMRIPLPPLEEQRRIVARVEAMAARIEEARELSVGSQRDMQSLLLSAYSEMIENVPIMRMSEIAPLIRRPVHIKLEENYYELGIRSFGKGTFHKSPLTGAELGDKKLFYIEPEDLLFNIVFAWEGAVAVARQNDQGRVGSHRFLSCIPMRDKALPEFLCFHFLTREGLNQLGLASPGGAGRNRTLGLKSLEKITVPVPDLQVQEDFSRLLKMRTEMIALQESSRLELDALLPSILAKAFAGEL